MTSIDKQPLYKKWWAWIILFMIVATIANSRESQMREAALPPAYEEENHTVPVTSEPIDEESPSETLDQETETMDSNNDEEADSVGNCCQITPSLVVGIDLDPGEYFIEADTQAYAFLQLTRNHSNTSDSIITTKLIPTHAFITVNDGEHLLLERGTLIHSSEAVVPTFISGVLEDGMYRVGIDIPAGKYWLEPTTAVAGYYQIASNSRGVASDLISSQNFSQGLEITLEEGQYLTLTRANSTLLTNP